MALPVNREIPVSKFPENFRRFVAPDAPPQMKMMAAQGLAPMPPVVQIAVLYQLWYSGDPEIRAAVEGTVDRMPANVVAGIAGKPMLPTVLDWLAARHARSRPVVEALIRNHTTDDETVVRLAKSGDEALCEMIAINQERLLRCPQVIEALYYNPSTRASTADRIVDFAARNGVDLSHLPGFAEVLEAIHGGGGPGEMSLEEMLDESVAEEIDTAFQAAHQATQALKLTDVDGEEAEEEIRSSSADRRIRGLNVAQKVRLALIGNMVERAILIKDTNKIVTRAVIRSPALSDQEVIRFSANKSLPDEIVTYMANNKNWTKHYIIKLNLVKNPKTPFSLAMIFLRMLRSSDLKILAKSKAIPSMVAKQAKLLSQKQSGGR